MVDFLASLMTIITAFVQAGKPAILPPHGQDEASLRGNSISKEAKNLDSNNSSFQEGGIYYSTTIVEETPERPNNGGEKLGESISIKVKTNLELEGTIKVQADNLKSGKTMPTLIPEGAVDNSVALESQGQLITGGGPVYGNKNDQIQTGLNPNTNATFGQEIAESQPDLAKEDGQGFGQTTSEKAKENSR